MFIQKDLRKVPRILSDAVKASEPPSFEEGHESSKEPEKLTELRLARRAPEFGGNLSILCQPRNAPALHHLTTLSLYDCQIRSLEGIGMLGSPASDGNSTICCPNLRELNIGRNPISTLPDELALLARSLTTLWCDDCQITGTIPNCVMKLSKLETLRMSNNAITHIPEEIENLSALRVLALDGNQLEMIPRQVSMLTKLSSLILRQNKIERIPDGIIGSNMPQLKLLHLSSNRLLEIPDSVAECKAIESLYINGNRIESIPVQLASGLSNMKTFNISNNNISSLPYDFEVRFGEPDAKTGVCSKDESCLVQLDQNPLVDQIQSELKAKQDAEQLDGAMAMEICAT